MPTEFVVPGANRASAALDLARTVVRRAERLVVSSPDRRLVRGPVPQPVVRPALGDGPVREGAEHLLARGAAATLACRRPRSGVTRDRRPRTPTPADDGSGHA